MSQHVPKALETIGRDIETDLRDVAFQKRADVVLSPLITDCIVFSQKAARIWVGSRCKRFVYASWTNITNSA